MLTLNVSIEEMRDMVRTTSPALDDELITLKGAFLHDLSIAGVETLPEGDDLAKAALRLYLRWQINHNAEGDRYYEIYTLTRAAMALSSDYKAVR